VFVSALTTGFLSASIVYDMDTSPQFRKEQPVWFGMFADSSMRRGASFFSLMVIGTLMLIARSLAYALLLTTRLKFAVYFFFGEIAFYFLQKALRNDLWFWVPVDGALGVFMSGAIHFALKVIVDFTGCVQFRLPCDLGGKHNHTTEHRDRKARTHPSTRAAEHMCAGRSGATSPAAGGVRGDSPRQPEVQQQQRRLRLLARFARALSSPEILPKASSSGAFVFLLASLAGGVQGVSPRQPTNPPLCPRARARALNNARAAQRPTPANT
jgi:hypothetical protein